LNSSGLGLSICLRLVDEHISKATTSSVGGNAYPQNLTIILTTRSASKSITTLSTLAAHLSKYSPEQQELVSFQPESVDLTSLLSVRRLARKLLADGRDEKEGGVPYLNAVICNAGIGGWIGIDWPRAIWTVTVDLVQSVTFPTFKLSSVGNVTARQLPDSGYGKENRGGLAGQDNAGWNDIANGTTGETGSEHGEGEPPLGEVFTANLFGHYMLSHYLMPLLSSPSLPEPHRGRVIFTSSIESGISHFTLSDPQGLVSPAAYESSKRMTDTLALTSRLPSTQHWVNSFLTPSPSLNFSLNLESSKTKLSNKPPPSSPPQPQKPQDPDAMMGAKPKIYVTHPGICATAIVPLPFILNLAMIAAMYFARLLGSPWHTTSSYLGATAPVWLALSDQRTLDDFETPPGGQDVTRPIKWGSSASVLGRECVRPTEVEGWGFQGLETDEVEGKKGRKRGARVASVEEREGFEETGRGVWRYMEGLRTEWENRLEEAD